ncbi:MAG: YybH family protein [Dongiales bacterium]|jgi:ketosteroid isomerase-like protein|nr:nuclear transport factor 2 family protein [Caulobacteraceae bacterium]
MNFKIVLASFLLAGSAQAKPMVDHTKAAEDVKAAVRNLVAGINAHNPDQATAGETADAIGMEAGRPDTLGRSQDRAGFKMSFAQSPSWRVGLIDENVDVARSGDMAIYRGLYHEDSVNDGVPMTHKVHFIAELRRQADGSWKMPWYVVSPTERSHKK